MPPVSPAEEARRIDLLKLMSYTEAAKKIGITTSSYWNWCARRGLKIEQPEKEPGKQHKLSAPSDMKLQARHDFIRSRPEWERLLIRRFGRHLVKAAAKADTKPDVGSFMREFQRLNIGGGILRQGGNANSIETGGKRKWKDDRSAAGRAKK